MLARGEVIEFKVDASNHACLELKMPVEAKRGQFHTVGYKTVFESCRNTLSSQ
jgi:hypothetical protein